MKLYEQIRGLYPSLTAEDFNPGSGTISLLDLSQGDGPFIDKWEHPELPRPTAEELSKAEIWEVSPSTPSEKLAAAGLTVEELKSLLDL